MQAIKDVSKLIKKNPRDERSIVFCGMLIALSKNEDYPIHRLYELDYQSFELALESLKEWRLDRYYAKLNPLLAEAQQVFASKL